MTIHYSANAENPQFRTPTGYLGGIFRFPASEKYGTSRAIKDAYTFIEGSKDHCGVKREILLASIAAGFYALYPELLRKSFIQPFSLALIGPPSTFKTTLTRKLRFPPTCEGDGEVEQSQTKAEQTAVWEACAGGSILLNDLRGQADDNKRLFHLLDSVVRPISDRKEGPVVAFLNGEPSFWNIKNFPESMRQRLLVVNTDALKREGRWVYEIDDAMVSEVLITIHDKLQGNSPWFDEIKECFHKEAEETFLEAVDNGRNVRSHNAAFLIRFAHQAILDTAFKSNFISEEEALHWLEITHKSVTSMLIRQEIREHSIEFAFQRCISNISGKLRLVEKRPFCGNGNWRCASGCTDYIGSHESCRNREYRPWAADLYLRDSELGIIFSTKYLDKEFLHFRTDADHLVVVVKWNQFKEEFLHVVREIEEQSSLKLKILEEDLKHFLVEEEHLLYKFRNWRRNIDHTISWPGGECYPVNRLVSDKTVRSIILYLPKELIKGASTDKDFYTFQDGEKKKGLPLDQLRAMWRGSPTLC